MDIISYIRHYLHDTDATRYPDELIQHYIKLAMIDFAIKTQFFIKEIAVDIIPNSKVAAILPPDIIELREVYFDNRPLPVVLESDLNDGLQCGACSIDLWKCKVCHPEMVILNTNVRELVLFPPICDKDLGDDEVDEWGIATDITIDTACKNKNKDVVTVDGLFGILPVNKGVTADVITDRLVVKYTYIPTWEDLYSDDNSASSLSTQAELTEIVKDFVCYKILLQDDDNKSITLSSILTKEYNMYVKEYKHRKANVMKTRGPILVGNMNEFAKG